jgi:hypothetical protein
MRFKYKKIRKNCIKSSNPIKQLHIVCLFLRYPSIRIKSFLLYTTSTYNNNNNEKKVTFLHIGGVFESSKRRQSWAAAAAIRRRRRRKNKRTATVADERNEDYRQPDGAIEFS